MPKISVITPSYNQGKYLRDTIEAVVGQGYSNLEYIVIDGGSTDGSVEIIKEFSDRIAYWESRQDGGQAEAINKGFGLATGDIVAWINSDDLLLPNALESIASSYVPGEEQILLGDVMIFDDSHECLWIAKQHGVTFENMLAIWQGSKMTWTQPGTFVSSNLIRQRGRLDESLHFAFDREWMCRLLKDTLVTYLDRPVAKFRLHDNSKTVSRSWAWLDELNTTTEKFGREVPGFNLARAKAQTFVSWGALPLLKGNIAKRDRRLALKALKAAFHLYPKIIFSLQFVVSVFLYFTPKEVGNVLGSLEQWWLRSSQLGAND